jgi:uncharacterized protein YbaR (Trm112 family)
MPTQLSSEFIGLLRCPESRARLAPADAGLLARLNAAIAQRHLKNKVGQILDTPLEGGLVREDGAICYPIVQDIPILLSEEGIPLDQLSG